MSIFPSGLQIILATDAVFIFIFRRRPVASLAACLQLSEDELVNGNSATSASYGCVLTYARYVAR
jgi:hypothetical protein